MILQKAVRIYVGVVAVLALGICAYVLPYTIILNKVARQNYSYPLKWLRGYEIQPTPELKREYESRKKDQMSALKDHTTFITLKKDFNVMQVPHVPEDGKFEFFFIDTPLPMWALYDYGYHKPGYREELVASSTGRHIQRLIVYEKGPTYSKFYDLYSEYDSKYKHACFSPDGKYIAEFEKFFWSKSSIFGEDEDGIEQHISGKMRVLSTSDLSMQTLWTLPDGAQFVSSTFNTSTPEKFDCRNGSWTDIGKFKFEYVEKNGSTHSFTISVPTEEEIKNEISKDAYPSYSIIIESNDQTPTVFRKLNDGRLVREEDLTEYIEKKIQPIVDASYNGNLPVSPLTFQFIQGTAGNTNSRYALFSASREWFDYDTPQFDFRLDKTNLEITEYSPECSNYQWSSPGGKFIACISSKDDHLVLIVDLNNLKVISSAKFSENEDWVRFYTVRLATFGNWAPRVGKNTSWNTEGTIFTIDIFEKEKECIEVEEKFLRTCGTPENNPTQTLQLTTK